MAASDSSLHPLPTPPAPVRPRRRWLRWLAGTLAVLALLFVLAWKLAPGFVSSMVEAALEDSLDVEASVEGLRLGLGGSLGIERVALTDRQGREVAQLGPLEASASLGALLRGRLEGSARLASGAVTFYEEPDGTWSRAPMPPESAEEDDGSGRPAPETSPERLPYVDFALEAPELELRLVPLEGPEQRLTADLALVVREGDTASLDRLELRSDVMSGTVQGRLENLSDWSAARGGLLVRDVLADLRYVPDGLRQLLAPFVALDLEGAEEQPLRLTVEGVVEGNDPADLVRDLSAQLEAGVGRLTVLEFTAEGDVRAQLAEGRLALSSDLGLNGGAFDLQADVDLAGLLSDAGARDTTFSVGLADVGLAAEFAPLLEPLHPMLSASKGLRDGTLDGTIDARVAFAVKAPLRLAELQADPGAFPLTALDADGSLGLAASLANLPLVDQLGSALGVELSDGAQLDPFAFSIREGRIGYDEPWTWTIDGLATKFAGSVGLDRSLDLTWRIPITERIAKRSSLLERLEGKQLAVPLTGSFTSPELGIAQALQQLAGDALEGTLEDALREQLEELDVLDGTGLEDLTGGDLGGALEQLEGRLGLGGAKGGEGAESNDPAELLKEADRLWKAGDKAAAQPLYLRIRKEFGLSPAYLLNRKRVKDRGDWKALRPADSGGR